MSQTENGGMYGLSARLYSSIIGRIRAATDLYTQVAEEASDADQVIRVLDVASGPGYLAIEIAKRLPLSEVVGVDISKDMVEAANRRVKKVGLDDRVHFLVGDAAKLPENVGNYDLVVCALALHHFSNPTLSLSEMRRVLKEGGAVRVYDMRADIPREAAKEFRVKYRRLISFFYTRIASSHARITEDCVNKLIKSSSASCISAIVESSGVYLKITLRK